MRDYNYTLKLRVCVHAENDKDAQELINDVFGPGEEYGITVNSLEITNVPKS